MRICYVDESGCTGTVSTAGSTIQPVFIPSGVVFEQAQLDALTLEFLGIKKKFFPGLLGTQSHFLDSILPEIKGAEIRRQVCSSSHRKHRHAIGFLDRLIQLLETYDAKIIGRVWVKGIGIPINGRALYTSSIQAICSYFQSFLESVNDTGLVIADSRSKPQNAAVSHSIFTKKFTTRGDSYKRILEMPTYGHSENHAGIQIADLVCSAFLFPLATYTYCTGYISSVHVQSGYSILKSRYGARLRQLQYRFRDNNGYMRGGITVCDNLGQRSSGLLFYSSPSSTPSTASQPAGATQVGPINPSPAT